MSKRKLEFMKLKIGSCNCLTKTPEYKFHDRFCYYRLLCEKEVADGNDFASNIRNKISPIKTFLQVCNRNDLSDMFKYNCCQDANHSVDDILEIIKEDDYDPTKL